MLNQNLSKASNEPFNINGLVDDTLCCIISYLPTYHKVKFALVCKRFNYLTLSEAKHEYARLSFTLLNFGKPPSIKYYANMTKICTILPLLFEYNYCRINTHRRGFIFHIYVNGSVIDDKGEDAVDEISMNRHECVKYDRSLSEIICSSDKELYDINVQERISKALNNCTQLKVISKDGFIQGECRDYLCIEDELLSVAPNITELKMGYLTKLTGKYPQITKLCIDQDICNEDISDILYAFPCLNKLSLSVYYLTNILSLGIKPGHRIKHIHIVDFYEYRAKSYDIDQSYELWKGKPKINLLTINWYENDDPLHGIGSVLGGMFKRVELIKKEYLAAY